jgi:phosphatidylglycerol:prolipoprotein diacylglycerol transferase
MADIAAYGVALGLFFGRVGCFLNGCCFGKACPVPPGVVFPRGSPAWREQLENALISRHDMTLPVHPTQLYQAVLNLGVFAALYWIIRPRKRRHGEVLGWLLILKAVARGVVEVWRDDERGVFFGFVSTAQIVGVFMVIAGVALLRWLAEQRRMEGAAA